MRIDGAVVGILAGFAIFMELYFNGVLDISIRLFNAPVNLSAPTSGLFAAAVGFVLYESVGSRPRRLEGV
jgi:hypothetical protein